MPIIPCYIIITIATLQPVDNVCYTDKTLYCEPNLKPGQFCDDRELFNKQLEFIKRRKW